MSSATASSTASKQQSARKEKSSFDSNLAPLLRHFVGIDLIVETKQGRTFRGQLREADAYMNLVLSRAVKDIRRAQLPSNEGPVPDEANKLFDLVHIRGPSIRYIVFGAKVDITGVIKAGRDRERAAGDKYRRGIRKARK